MRFRFSLTVLLTVLIYGSLAGQNTIDRSIEWKKPQKAQINQTVYKLLNFKGVEYSSDSLMLPVYAETIPLEIKGTNPKARIIDAAYENIPQDEITDIRLPDNLPDEISIEASIQIQKKRHYLNYSLIPIRKNPQTGTIERLVSFTVTYETQSSYRSSANVRNYVTNSVLRTGNWVKIALNEDGIYKISASELNSMGFNNPLQVKMFGNEAGMLPLRNADPAYDDLSEMAIIRTNDYIMFYAKGPTKWNYDNQYKMFRHELHKYSDFSYYFLTDNVGIGRTVETENQISGTALHTVTKFNDFLYHEKEDTNLIKSGRNWYGEEFGIVDDMDFTFNFPNIVTGSPVKFLISAIARSTQNSDFYIYESGNQVSAVENISKITIDPDYSYAFGSSSFDEFFVNSSSFTLNVMYSKPNSSAKGWLNYMTLNALRELKMNGHMMHFRDTSSTGPGQTAKFVLSGAGSSVKIWDVSDIVNVKDIKVTSSGSEINFTLETEELREFFAFDGSSFLSINSYEEVVNQDIHGAPIPDFIIVTPEIFQPYAEQLADIHREIDKMDVLVVKVQEVYNEFSSGAPDVSAIRNMARMFYERATNEEEMTGYMLFFGDGSYDNKSDKQGNSNFILTYQSSNSLHPISSYVTDDFFGFLDPTESPDTGSVDIGIGRLPVSSESQAQMAIDKIKSYTSPSTFGDWRNIMCFIGDDSDNEFSVQHMSTAEEICNYLAEVNPSINFDKIYLDAYPQFQTASGQRYPDAELAIENRMKNGALVVNYTGHGNELGLTHEQVIVISDILSWSNFEKLPLFMTATCEFSRFDDYGRTSGGELIFLNSKGGGIGLVTTTRPVYPSSLSYNFYEEVFRKTNGEYYRLGDLLMLAKNNTGSMANVNKKKFAILGDPALKLAYPKHEIVTTEINGVPITESTDTLKALSYVTISGHIADQSGNIIEDFNGVVYPKVYDKARYLATLGNEGNNPLNYTSQTNILYRGKASIINGHFTFSFIVPKDISYDFGFGKLSYYAHNETVDASGSSNKIYIGGSINQTSFDNTGPEISIFMNDESFINGGITNENPRLLAFVNDSTGINTVGNGIGHDIVAVLDGNHSASYNLNDYYEADLDSYQSGRIEYPFTSLDEGEHSIKLKVWDVSNNSGTDSIEFIVAGSADIAIRHLFNYPNPFTNNTAFYFEHNQSSTQLDVMIQIFTVSGRLVKTIDASLFSDGFRLGPIEWDGLDDFGNKIGRGVYFYKASLRNESGNTIEKLEKLVILK